MRSSVLLAVVVASGCNGNGGAATFDASIDAIVEVEVDAARCGNDYDCDTEMPVECVDGSCVAICRDVLGGTPCNWGFATDYPPVCCAPGTKCVIVGFEWEDCIPEDEEPPPIGPYLGWIELADVSVPGRPELGSGALVSIAFHDIPTSPLPVYDDRVAGEGCAVWTFELDGTEFEWGDVEVTVDGTASPVPTCNSADPWRWGCPDVFSFGAGAAGDIITPLGGGEAEVSIASASFGPDHVGMWLLLGAPDTAVYPIVAVTDATHARLSGVTLASPSDLAGMPYQATAGLGPTPAERPFLDDGTALVTVEARSQSDFFSWIHEELHAGGAGVALAGGSDDPNALPTTGDAVSFLCDGAGGICGAADVTAVSAITTNASVDGLSDSTMPRPVAGAQIAMLRCLELGGTGDLQVPAGAMAALLATSPTRIETRYVRASLAGGPGGRTVLVGHGVIGWTTP